jgi:hypothetical protein
MECCRFRVVWPSLLSMSASFNSSVSGIIGLSSKTRLIESTFDSSIDNFPLPCIEVYPMVRHHGIYALLLAWSSCQVQISIKITRIFLYAQYFLYFIFMECAPDPAGTQLFDDATLCDPPQWTNRSDRNMTRGMIFSSWLCKRLLQRMPWPTGIDPTALPIVFCRLSSSLTTKNFRYCRLREGASLPASRTRISYSCSIKRS